MKNLNPVLPAWNRQEMTSSLAAFVDHAKRSMAGRPLISGAAVCYAAVLGLMIYNVASHARLESWRQTTVQVAPAMQPASALTSVAPSCAEFAGMGQRLCSAEAKFEATRAKFQERVETRKERIRMSVGVKSDQRVKSVPAFPVAAETPAYIPEQPESIKPTLAARE